MKIRSKIAFLFTVLIGVLNASLLTVVFLAFQNYTTEDFFSRLKNRALITAQIFLERDELSTQIYSKIRQEFFIELPEEIIKVYDNSNIPRFTEQHSHFDFDDALINQIRHRKELKITEGNRQIIGLHYTDNQGDFIIIASAIDFYGIKKLRNLRQLMIVGYCISLVIVYFTGLFFAQRVLLPVNNVIYQVKQIEAINLSQRVDEGNGKDEIAVLAQSFNELLDRVEAAFKVQQQFIHNASHELRTPLTTILGEIEVILIKDRSVEEYKQLLNLIQLETERLVQLTKSLLQLAKVDIQGYSPKLQPLALDELIFAATSQLQARYPDLVLELQVESESNEFVILAQEDLLYTAVYNLLDNAAKYSNKLPVKIWLQNQTDKIIFKIIDQGIGISDKDIQQIGNTFFRGENTRNIEGFGLGFMLAKKVLELHQALWSIQSESHKGTVVSVIFRKINR